jgi:hypothetical protein
LPTLVAQAVLVTSINHFAAIRSKQVARARKCCSNVLHFGSIVHRLENGQCLLIVSNSIWVLFERNQRSCKRAQHNRIGGVAAAMQLSTEGDRFLVHLHSFVPSAQRSLALGQLKQEPQTDGFLAQGIGLCKSSQRLFILLRAKVNATQSHSICPYSWPSANRSSSMMLSASTMLSRTEGLGIFGSVGSLRTSLNVFDRHLRTDESMAIERA